MKLILAIQTHDAPREAVGFQQFLREHDIPGLMNSQVIEETPGSDTMSGGLISGAIALLVNESIKKVVGEIFDIFFKHFSGRRAAFELSGECPETGKTFSLKYDGTTEGQREEIVEEFERLYREMCSSKP